MNTLHQLPTLEDFKQKVAGLKQLRNIEKSTHALHELAVLYGYKNYNSIKPYLVEKNAKFNKLPKDIKHYTTANGQIIDSRGLYKTSCGYLTHSDKDNSTIPKHEIKKALCFIDHLLVKRKTINKKASSSYGLKHHAEEYLRHYGLFKDDISGAYVSNAAMIVALDLRGFDISYNEYNPGPNISTNYSTRKEISRNTIHSNRHNEEFYKARIRESFLPLKEDITLRSDINVTNTQALTKEHIKFLNLLISEKGKFIKVYKFLYFDKKRAKGFFQPLVNEGIISKLALTRSSDYSSNTYSNIGYFYSVYDLKFKDTINSLFVHTDNVDLIEYITTLE